MYIKQITRLGNLKLIEYTSNAAKKMQNTKNFYIPPKTTVEEDKNLKNMLVVDRFLVNGAKNCYSLLKSIF